jgi:hypothetical protein
VEFFSPIVTADNTLTLMKNEIGIDTELLARPNAGFPSGNISSRQGKSLK